MPDFPDCPPELSEPQWASLAFDPHCHVSERLGNPISPDDRFSHSFVFVLTSEPSIGFYESESVPSAQNYSMCSPLKLQKRNQSFTSLADSVEDDDNYDDLISAIPTRCGSMPS